MGLPGDQTSGSVSLQQAEEIDQEAFKKVQASTEYQENSVIDIKWRTQKNFSTVLPIESLNRLILLMRCSQSSLKNTPPVIQSVPVTAQQGTAYVSVTLNQFKD
ncbi:MAG TPA: hypothetical protein DCQ08_03625 [Amoebophilaceae bacterium]|nr:hypothetical protein [Amoebophilaceae bacterium]